RTLTPSVENKALLVIAGDHGIVASGVSAYPQVVTGEMVKTFLRGGAGINVLAHQIDAQVVVMDAGIIPDIPPQTSEGGYFTVRKIARGTNDFSKDHAMTKDQAETAILNGFEAARELFEEGVELLGTGDMGIGNTSPSSAIGAVIIRVPVERITGRGTGVDDDGFHRKCGAIKRGIELNNPNAEDPLDVLSKVGGFEIGAIAGAILSAAFFKKPIVIDGFISGAGALIAHGLCPVVTDYLFAGHKSAEQGHHIMLEYLGLSPILDLEMRLGEGTGAALAMHVIEAAARVMNEILTFEEAGVSKNA
ncbi:MAG: nicotinate-nucleotide--dimethylbenzimidazole phosphoribosyltransferase, partial [Deltaproteobacteria bacterium]|nr:nicotinate-nucleotide--dimethylbenzimidazole phosphoribosyltransferase [Deltaproteobacteria bacterium]MBW2340847.1 nicotinate-nucleotide--dimethylbenzimidazole phosphoribosyltransferase [Deltaproteobacteria bacterium]